MSARRSAKVSTKSSAPKKSTRPQVSRQRDGQKPQEISAEPAAAPSVEPKRHRRSDCIEIRGVRQNNLKGFDLDLPLGKLIVVTGPSGSGKSSLAFDTIYAEGQRRYVETFSPYTRQFFERMDKPQVDDIRGIPPAIAIEQSNSVRTTRSTVGTMTEINDYLKLLWPRLATAVCPSCQQEVRPDTPSSAATAAQEKFAGQEVLVTFPVPVPAKTPVADFFAFLQGQGFLRVLLFGKMFRTDESEAFSGKSLPGVVDVIQDRVRLEGPENQTASRFHEALEQAFHYGKGRAKLIVPDKNEALSFSRGWHCAACDLTLREPSPALFSFNNPIGACPECRGFGRVIGIDLDRAMPDKSLSIRGGLVRAFQGNTMGESQKDLIKAAKGRGVDIDTPFEDLSKKHQEWVIEGDNKDPEQAWKDGEWYGVRGFFKWAESRQYKMHVRVFLSRYRAYTTCGVCRGARLQPEALNFRIKGQTLPDFWQSPVSSLMTSLSSLRPMIAKGDGTTEMLRAEIENRLRYLDRVGLGYLTLDRPARTLSGGEVERVNLTSCLGASLVNTLFVMDEPSVGLHPRDVTKMIEVMRDLRDKGNTLLVVEHEESVIRAADQLVDIGPGRGRKGGELVFQGQVPEMGTNANKDWSLKNKDSGEVDASLTLAYLSGQKSIPIPAKRRPLCKGQELKIIGARQHNLRKLDVTIPLGVMVCLTGVSGSGKSTLVHEVLYENLIRLKGESSENEPGQCKELKGAEKVGEVVMVDQSPLSKTPRSTPAVYIGAFDAIRQLFAAIPASKAEGLTASFFSFNSGTGRCQRCMGAGFEKVEMQFLSDLFVTCPACDGTRYSAAVQEYRVEGKTVAEVLELTVDEALEFLSDKSANACQRLQLLADVGLGYLKLGQPLNTLSGGESQRLKLVSHLAETANAKRKSLLIFDEPTTGLHFDDVALLLKVFHRLVDDGHSLIVIEHNLEVIKNADWVIDLGPEAGADGGKVVAEGPPEDIAKVTASHTGRYLAGVLGLGGPDVSELAKLPFPDNEEIYDQGRILSQVMGGRVAAALGVLASSSQAVRAQQVAEFLRGNQEQPPSEALLERAEVLGSELQETLTNAISVRGAREHNLKNISVDIPRDQFVVITGLSGSGKSTLAFDILFAEGQRRFLDSMSAYARQFVEQMERPDVDHIAGLPPTVAIEQRITRGGGKSTVATVTEVYHFLRLLWSKVGIQHCPDCSVPVTSQTPGEIAQAIAKLAAKMSVKILSTVVKARKGFHDDIAKWAGKQGFEEMLVDGQFIVTEDFKRLERFKEHTIDVVIATVPAGSKATLELQRFVERGIEIGKGALRVCPANSGITAGGASGAKKSKATKSDFTVFSTSMTCPECALAFEPLDPRLFSFNSPHGWCPDCRGFGFVPKRRDISPDRPDESQLEAELRDELRSQDDDEESGPPQLCPTCHGARLNRIGSAVQVHGLALDAVTGLPVDVANEVIKAFTFTGRDDIIARDILKEISQRLDYMDRVGLGYLQLNRSARTLSGGESQRIRLASQLGSNLRGVLYVLDEPTIGLHPRDNVRLLDTLTALRDKGNSVIVVEHDEETMRRADYVFDLGPGAGRFGGEIVAQGTLADISSSLDSPTGAALRASGVVKLGNPVISVGPYDVFHGQTDIVWLVAPSTSGRNTLPIEFARCLQAQFGGEMILEESYSVVLSRTEAKNRVGYVAKLTEPTIIDIFDPTIKSRLEGKFIVVVDDIFTSGETVEVFETQLARHGIFVDAVAVLGAVKQAAPADKGLRVEFARLLATSTGEKWADVLKEIEIVHARSRAYLLRHGLKQARQNPLEVRQALRQRWEALTGCFTDGQEPLDAGAKAGSLRGDLRSGGRAPAEARRDKAVRASATQRSSDLSQLSSVLSQRAGSGISCETARLALQQRPLPPVIFATSETPTLVRRKRELKEADFPSAQVLALVTEYWPAAASKTESLVSLGHPYRGERRPVVSLAKGKGELKQAALTITGANANNLKDLTLAIPLQRLTVITGVSGSGKSSFMRSVLHPAVRSVISKEKSRLAPTWKSISGAEMIDAVYEVDQSPIGKTSRSCPATYIGIFDDIRKLFAQIPIARMRGYTHSRFSFNTEGGRCETCKGNGQVKLEMAFLPSSWIPCEDCHGLRYNQPTLEVEWNGKNIGQIMQLSITDAAEFFSSVPSIARPLRLLADTGIGYLQLGQPSPTLSGGEAQRIKLVTELTRGIGRSENTRLRKNLTPKGSLYLIEEPTIGLHMTDVRRLIDVLHRLVDDGHTVVVIEHNLDVAAEADWIIDIGPEAGDGGGELVAAGPPEAVAKNKRSQTAPFLGEVLSPTA